MTEATDNRVSDDRILSKYIQVDCPPLIKERIAVAAARHAKGNQSNYIRKAIYKQLMDDELLTATELAHALSGIAMI